MSFDAGALATKISQKRNQARDLWFKVLESARTSLKISEIDDTSLEALAQSAQTPEKFTVVTRLIYQYGKTQVGGESISGLLFKFANESPFSLAEWIDAIELMHLWMEKNKRKTDFLHLLQYLECCRAAPEAQEGGQTFVSILQDMLDVHGYDGK